jgi:hypothetical protein
VPKETVSATAARSKASPAQSAIAMARKVREERFICRLLRVKGAGV